MEPHDAPGVHVEEVAFRPPAITDVPMGVAGFVGAVGSGDPAEPLTSVADVDARLGRTDPQLHAAARCFFVQGGERLHLAADLDTLAALEDVRLVAAPGAPPARWPALIDHVERVGGRVALLDAPDAATGGEVRALRETVESTRAVLLHPWLTADGTDLPPSGAVAGTWVRVDRERGVGRSAGGTALVGPIGVQQAIRSGEEAVLNVAGVTVLRDLPGRGVHLRGARTISADPEWRYVPVRRYADLVEHSIGRGLPWAVFEPNDEPLWVRVRSVVEDYLVGHWHRGALQGDDAQDAFFVRCDRSTMTQADVDAGRLIVMVGLAVVRPAEFLVLRIGLWTADRTDP